MFKKLNTRISRFLKLSRILTLDLLQSLKIFQRVKEMKNEDTDLPTVVTSTAGLKLTMNLWKRISYVVGLSFLPLSINTAHASSDYNSVINSLKSSGVNKVNNKINIPSETIDLRLIWVILAKTTPFYLAY